MEFSIFLQSQGNQRSPTKRKRENVSLNLFLRYLIYITVIPMKLYTKNEFRHLFRYQLKKWITFSSSLDDKHKTAFLYLYYLIHYAHMHKM